MFLAFGQGGKGARQGLLLPFIQGLAQLLQLFTIEHGVFSFGGNAPNYSTAFHQNGYFFRSHWFDVIISEEGR